MGSLLAIVSFTAWSIMAELRSSISASSVHLRPGRSDAIVVTCSVNSSTRKVMSITSHLDGLTSRLIFFTL